MPDPIKSQIVSQMAQRWQQVNSPQHLTLNRPFALTPPTQLQPPGQVFSSDRLNLNIKGANRMPAVMVLQRQASASSINRAVDIATGTQNTYNNNVELLVDGKEAFAKMRDNIRSAKQSVYVEMFLFHGDETGWSMARELVAKRKEGVDVKVLLDALGQVTEKGEVVKFMRDNGVDVQLYNKKLFDWENVNITHRKLVLVDGYKGITGGMNIGQEYEHEWHDLMASVEGAAVQDLQSEFFVNWAHSGGKVPANPPKLPVGVTFGNTASRITVTSPYEPGKEKDTKNAMISAINSALSHIYVMNPYFSEEDVIQSLEQAHKRGVKVKVVLPALSDDPAHAVLNKRNAERLAKQGIEVLKVDRGPDGKTLTHGKLMTIDGIWTTIGSTNLDSRALHNNQELNLSVTDAEFTRTVEDRLFNNNKHALKPYDASNFSTWERMKAQAFSLIREVF